MDVLMSYARDPATVFKFVIADAGDLNEVNEVIDAIGATRDQVWLMPLTNNRAELLNRSAEVADLAIAHGFSYSGRAQLLLWDNERGR